MGIELKNLQVGYDNNIIISNANLKIPKGKITMFIGCNGCGKSTLLKSIARVIPLKSGEIFLNGENIKNLPSKDIAKKIAILPQSPIMPDGIVVKDLVSYGRYPYQKPFSSLTNDDLSIIDWAMDKTGVLEWKNKRLNELSGGQLQRVWISLVLAQKTKILLLDEPITYLDMAHQLEILEFLRKLNKDENTTIVLVIHELNHATKFADYIVGIKEGKILFEGVPKDVINVENLRNLYGIDAKLIISGEEGYPICLDYSLIDDNK